MPPSFHAIVSINIFKMKSHCNWTMTPLFMWRLLVLDLQFSMLQTTLESIYWLPPLINALLDSLIKQSPSNCTAFKISFHLPYQWVVIEKTRCKLIFISWWHDPICSTPKTISIQQICMLLAYDWISTHCFCSWHATLQIHHATFFLNHVKLPTALMPMWQAYALIPFLVNAILQMTFYT